MNKRYLFVGIFVTVALALLTTGLFLIGNQHKAFRLHVELYTDFGNLEGVAKGAKVRVDGMDAGQVQDISIPSKPSEKFRVKMQIDDRLHGLIRTDSLVSISTEGIVGDKYLLIQGGNDQSPEAPAKSTLASKEPFEISKLMEQASGLLGQAGNTMTDVRGKLDGALDAVTKTVNNTNGIVTDLRRGKGAAGMLLEDPVTAQNVQQTILNTRDATAKLNTASAQVNDLLSDFRQRNLFERTQHTIDDTDRTVNDTDHAVQQFGQVAGQLHTTLDQAFAEDQYGNSAGANLQQSLTNLNHASGNLADDTAALKQEFFFKGFFKRRGYEDLSHIPATPYREGKLFQKLTPHRVWLMASSMFTYDANGKEILSTEGQAQLDSAVAQLPALYSTPIVIEGYSEASTPAEQLIQSRHRAALVRAYLQIRFHLEPKELGIIALSNQPPADAGRSSWNGVCLVSMTPR